MSLKLTIIQTNLEDCADAFIMAAKNSTMTGQKIQIGESQSVMSNPSLIIVADAGLII